MTSIQQVLWSKFNDQQLDIFLTWIYIVDLFPITYIEIRLGWIRLD